MKVIKYIMDEQAVTLTWSEKNEEIAKVEATNGEYEIKETEALGGEG